jgi:hypothetical protein
MCTLVSRSGSRLTSSDLGVFSSGGCDSSSPRRRHSLHWFKPLPAPDHRVGDTGRSAKIGPVIEPRVRCNRACIARDLVLLASTADQQLEYLTLRDVPREELILQWLDWDCDVLPEVIEAGALTDELVETLQSVTAEIAALNERIGQEGKRLGTMEPHRRAHSDEALRTWSEWEHIRVLSRMALQQLSDLGVTARTLTDPLYHDAPIDCDELRRQLSSEGAP